MIIAAIAAVGALLDAQGLSRAAQSAADAWMGQAVAAADMSMGDVGGSRAMSVQELSGVASGLNFRMEGPSNTLRTGDIALNSGSGDVAFTGILSTSSNTGLGSVVQSAVSVAAGAIQLGAAAP